MSSPVLGMNTKEAHPSSRYVTLGLVGWPLVGSAPLLLLLFGIHVLMSGRKQTPFSRTLRDLELGRSSGFIRKQKTQADLTQAPNS